MSRPTNLAFIMEQHLGHETYAANLRSIVTGLSDVTSEWVGVSYEPTDQWWERIPSSTLKGALRGRREVMRGMSTTRPDARVFNTQVPAVIAGRRARAQPYVLCTDVTPIQLDKMSTGYEHRPDRAGPERWLKHRWNCRVFSQAAAHAPWSTWARDSLIADYGVDPDTIEVIPPGVDAAAWAGKPDHAEGPMRILFVGGDFSRKGGDLLLGALSALDHAEVAAVTRSSVRRHPGLEVFNGLKPNDPRLRELFRSSDVFVLPSRAETFGIAAVEAAAAGLPVVVTGIGGLADLVVDGTTGFSIPPGDGEALVRALRCLEADPALRLRMGQAGRRRAETEFDAAMNAERLVRLAVAAAQRAKRRTAVTSCGQVEHPVGS